MTSTSLQVSPYIVRLRRRRADDGRERLLNLATLEEYAVSPGLMALLETCATPQPADRLADDVDPAEIHKAVAHHLIIAPETRWELHTIQRVEIETHTACNWRCEYCPVRTEPKPRASMGLDLFERIIDKSARHPSVARVSFHSYSEPGIDRHFAERVRILARTRLKLDLFSNGSTLDGDVLRMLKDAGVVASICFNLPTLDEARFARMTGSRTRQQTLRNIDEAIALGFPVRFSVIDSHDEWSAENLAGIRRRYEPLVGSPIHQWATTDRAGLVPDQHARHVAVENPRLFGCYLPVFQLHVGVTGNCFICCEDYHQLEVFAHIDDGEIDEVLNGGRATLLRQRIFGGALAPPDFICRRCETMRQAAALTRPIVS
jgi:hypothetical protein